MSKTTTLGRWQDDLFIPELTARPERTTDYATVTPELAVTRPRHPPERTARDSNRAPRADLGARETTVFR